MQNNIILVKLSDYVSIYYSDNENRLMTRETCKQIFLDKMFKESLLLLFVREYILVKVVK